MNKKDARFQIDSIIMSVRVQAHLLEKCNHSKHPNTYAHHVRDRISESIVDDLNKVIQKLHWLADGIDAGISDSTPQDDTEDKVPF